MGFLKKKYSDSIDFSKVNIIIKDLLINEISKRIS